ncbi:MAG TPA: selenoneine synthase SenA [candidate division Zixibacteria bacterium]|nr:selenoneine synthase SenA [candidate division Zixibacteria bacterium]
MPAQDRGIASLADPARLSETMREFRARTLSLVADLDPGRLIGPRLLTVNPPLWEIGHVAWFQEFWVLRHLLRRRPLIENGDRLYNSTDIPHDSRWELPLPSLDETLRYMDAVQSRAIDSLDMSRPLSPDEFYFYLLATFHEGMHAEAIAATRQALAYPAPELAPASLFAPLGGGPCPGDVDIAGGRFQIGATPDFPFVFDNEKWAHWVHVAPFRIARAPVTNGEFAEFVEAGGYDRSEYWSAEGWRWRRSGGVPNLGESFAKFWQGSGATAEIQSRSAPIDHPVYWRRGPGGRWEQRVFDRYVPLNEHLPVMHVSWYEAEAYCNWANRRLPTEAEWELAASAEGTGDRAARRRRFPWGDLAPDSSRANLDWRHMGPVEVGAYPEGDSAFGCRQMIGNVWEWTADDFGPYPGFSPDPYREYSQPWFGTHKVLRGGCWATSSLLIRNTWRNFYTPDRCDVWAGFRTCAR